MSRWAVASRGSSLGVKQLALKGPVRCEASHQDAGRGSEGAWRVNEVPKNLRDISPLPRNNWQSLGH
jgi:hypothetical protein